MSTDDDSGWMYTDSGKPRDGMPDIARIMQGEGLDEEDGPFRHSRDREIQNPRKSAELITCTCDVNVFSKSANALLESLRSRPQIFPKSPDQLESFRALGGYASGRWSRFVNVGSSQATTNDEFGFISLYNKCAIPGHWCKVWQTGEDTFNIEGLSNEQFIATSALISVWDVEEGQQDSDDEADYDDRTFGALDTFNTVIEDESSMNAIKEWQEQVFPEQDIREFLENSLAIEDVFALARFMPAHEVVSWVSKFGDQSMFALRVLQIGLGSKVEGSTADRKIAKNVDSIVRGIRNLIQKEIKKSRKLK